MKLGITIKIQLKWNLLNKKNGNILLIQMLIK